MSHDIIILGGGPAGCAAALFAARTKNSVLMLHRGTNPGIHNFQWLLPGSPKEMGARDWLENIRTQVKEAGVTWEEEGVTEVTLGETQKQIKTDKKTYEAPVIILASGCHDRQGLIDGEAELSGRGVSYNAFQDGFQYNGESVAIEGKNDVAAKEALFLSRLAKEVYFIIPAAKLDIEENLLEQLRNTNNMLAFYSSSIKSIHGDNQVQSVKVLEAGTEKDLPVKAVFLYARVSHPKHDLLKDKIQIAEDGCVCVDQNMMTSVPGVFACGDIIAGQPQFPFVAASQGLVAGMNAVRYLHGEPKSV